MKVLLIQPAMNWQHNYLEAPSTALLILGTLAKYRGHKVKILHLDVESLDVHVDGGYPDIVGITVNTFQVKSAREIVQSVRALSRDINIVIGGPHACAWENEPQVNKVIIGEGENRWLDLLGETPTINCPDDIPPIDYSLVNLSKANGIGPMVGAHPSFCMMASRGCIGQCTFCNTPIHWGQKIRYHSPEYIINEVKRLNQDYGAREIFFQDDTFNINHHWATEIFEGIIRNEINKKVLFRITGRVNEKLVTKEYLDLAYRAGVWNIFYGVESGSQYMLDRMKKGICVDEIKRAIKMTHEAHITTICSFIVGMPGESHESLRETDALISEIKPFHYGWGWACPFPKTAFREEVIKSGHIQDRDYGDYVYGMSITRTDALDYDELRSFKGFSYK